MAFCATHLFIYSTALYRVQLYGSLWKDLERWLDTEKLRQSSAVCVYLSVGVYVREGGQHFLYPGWIHTYPWS